MQQKYKKKNPIQVERLHTPYPWFLSSFFSNREGGINRKVHKTSQMYAATSMLFCIARLLWKMYIVNYVGFHYHGCGLLDCIHECNIQHTRFEGEGRFPLLAPYRKNPALHIVHACGVIVIIAELVTRQKNIFGCSDIVIITHPISYE